MVATDVERLAVLIEANTKSYERAMLRLEGKTNAAVGKASRSINRLDRSLKAASLSARNFARNFATGFGVGAATFGAAALATAIRSTVTELSRIADVADKVGVTTDALQELRFAAEQNGIASTQLDTAIQRFSRRVAEAANGTGELAKIFKANNVQLRDSKGRLKPLNEILSDYADLVKNAGSKQEQLLLSFKAFDTEGAQFVLVLENGRQGLDDFAAELRKLNGVINEDSVRALDTLDDRFGAAATKLKKGFQRVVVDTFEFLTKLSDKLKEVERQQGTFEEFLARGSRGRFDRPGDLDPPETNAPPPRRTGGTGGRAGRRTIIPNPGGDTRRKAIDRVVEGLRFEAEQLGKTSTQQRINNELRAAGVDLNSRQGREIAGLVTQIESQTDALQNLADVGDVVAGSLEDAFDDFLETGKLNFKSFVDSAIKDLLRLQFQTSVIQPLTSAFGGGGSPGGGFNLGSLIGFNTGGSFTVGGRGGIDRNTLSLNNRPIANVSRGERVNVGRGGGGGTDVVVNNFSSEKASARVTRGPDGRQLAEIVIGRQEFVKAVDKQIRSGTASPVPR